jgi:hypothetical protein
LLYLDQTLVVAPQSAFAQTLRLKYQPDNSMPIQSPAFGIADLSDALAAQVRQVGEPVSVRLHLSVADSQTDWQPVAQSALAIVGAVFDIDSFNWRGRPASAERILNLLGQNEIGHTTLVTLARGYDSTIAVTLFGNHGVARFDEASVSLATDDLLSPLPEALQKILLTSGSN